jgi:hypothetical protein
MKVEAQYEVLGQHSLRTIRPVRDGRMDPYFSFNTRLRGTNVRSSLAGRVRLSSVFPAINCWATIIPSLRDKPIIRREEALIRKRDRSR